jgi:hypothetical protein
MPNYERAIEQLYGQAELAAKILAALRDAGKDLDALTQDDLGSFDELHDGERESTNQLARLAGLREGMHVLDVGSGLGGPARGLASEYGCRVTGLDLVEEFCRAATTIRPCGPMTRSSAFSCRPTNAAVCSSPPVIENACGTTSPPRQSRRPRPPPCR